MALLGFIMIYTWIHALVILLGGKERTGYNLVVLIFAIITFILVLIGMFQ